MPITFRVLPEHGLVLARFSGFITVADSLASLQAVAADPDHRPDLKQLIDFSGVTGHETDYVRILEFMARMPDAGFPPGLEFLVVYYAPTPVGRDLARIVMRSWDGVTGPVLRMVGDADQALAILGLPELSFADLLAATG